MTHYPVINLDSNDSSQCCSQLFNEMSLNLNHLVILLYLPLLSLLLRISMN